METTWCLDVVALSLVVGCGGDCSGGVWCRLHLVVGCGGWRLYLVVGYGVDLLQRRLTDAANATEHERVQVVTTTVAAVHGGRLVHFHDQRVLKTLRDTRTDLQWQPYSMFTQQEQFLNRVFLFA